MESTAVNRKWMLCSVASFIGFLFLVFCMDQGRRQSIILLASVETLEVPRSGSPDMAGGAAVSSVDTSVGSSSSSSSPGASIAAAPQPTTVAPIITLQSGEVESGQPQSTFELLSNPHEQAMAYPPGEAEVPPAPMKPPSRQPSAAAPPAVYYQSSLAEVESTPPPSTAMPPQSAGESAGSSAGDNEEEEEEEEEEECNLFQGRWVYDPEAYPLYRAPQCPFLSEQVSCQRNGRPDSDYEHWRWQPRACDLPRFHGKSVLERLKGKRVVIVGDSLNRNQWESLSCLLYSSVQPSRAVVKSQSAEHKVFRALDYDCTVEFFWSPFLVHLEVMDSGKKVIKLDKLPSTARRWRNADVVVFNTAHWWTHRGKLRMWDFYERRGELVEDMDMNIAFETAMRTWSRWVNKRVNPARTKVFFRSLSPEHKPENLHWCYNQTHPITNETYIQWFPRSMTDIVEKTMEKMRTPVTYLNITRLSEFRREAHTSVYTVKKMKLLTGEQRKQPKMYADCSHWCLPGLPDTWNVLLFASLFDSP